MSTRQNKKQRKGRNNANNRERTVTTLTEDPTTHYLVPTPSEEPAGSHSSPPSFAASGPAAGQIHNMSMGPQSYPIPGNFSYGYATPFSSAQHTNMHQPQQPYYPTSPQQASQQPPTKSALPPGKSDLEILQNLKKLIKDGQHPFYRAVPSPAALASLYKGPIPAQFQPESSEEHSSGLASTFGPAARDNDRRQPRRQGKDPRNLDKSNNTPGNRSKNGPPSSVANLNLGALQISKDGSGPPSAGLRSGVPRIDDVSGNHAMSMDVDRLAHVESGSVYSDQSRTWVPRDATPRSAVPSSDDLDLALDRDATPHPPPAVDSTSANPPNSFEGVDRRPASAHDGYDQRAYSAGREWYPNDHDRRIVYERPPRDIRPPESYRPAPLPESGSYKAELGPPPPASQAPSENSAALDKRPEAHISVSVDAPQLSIHTHENPPSARDPDAALPTADPHAQQYARSDPHVSPPHYADHPSSDVEDVRSSRSSSARPPDASGVPSPAPPPTSAESVPSAADNSIMPPPSLKERINPNQPVAQQLKSAAEAAPVAEQPPAPQQQHERFGKKNKFQKGHHFIGPNKFGRQGSPGDGPPPGSGGHGARTFRPRSPSSDRKPREYRGPPPPPPRDISRDRAAYRAEYDPRRPEIIDPDISLSARYDGRPYSDFSPAPGSERRPSAYPSPPLPLTGGRGPATADTPAGRNGDYYTYPTSRGDWDIEDDDYYKSRSWDRSLPPSAERERFERDPYGPRPGSWDARQDREFVPRDAYPPGPPGAPIPLDDRYPPGPPISRDTDRPGRPPPPGYSAPYGRVRGRSPSPDGRAGPNAIDDARPPMKRAREDFPPEYYPSGRPPPRRPSAPEYPPPRSGGQSSSAEWPPPLSGGSGGPPPPRSRRDYRPAGREPPLEYGAPYERAPQGPPGRMTYGPGGHPANDRGGYARPPQ